MKRTTDDRTKRVFDVVVAVALLLLTSPIKLATAMAIRDVVNAVSVVMANKPARDRVSGATPADYLIDNTSSRAVNFIMSTTRRHAAWAGLRHDPV